MSRRFSTFALLSTLSLSTLVLGSCATDDLTPEFEPRSLVAFQGCTDLVAYARTQFEEQLEKSYKINGGGFLPGVGVGVDDAAGIPDADMGDDESASDDDSSPEEAPQSPGAASGDVPDHSKTNVQEQGVDEPDLVKTDGRRMFTLSHGILRVADLSGDKARLTDSVDLRQIHNYGGRAEMLLHNNTVLLIQNFHPGHFGKSQGMAAKIYEIDVSIAGQAKVLRELELQGNYVSSRKVGNVVRVVMRNSPRDLEFRGPWYFFDANNAGFPNGAVEDEAPGMPDMPMGTTSGGSTQTQAADSGSDESATDRTGSAQSRSYQLGGPSFDQAAWNEAVSRARQHNALVLSKMNEQNLLPKYRFVDRQSGAAAQEGLIYGCEQTLRPGLKSGVQMLSVITIDLETGLAPNQGTGIMADASTVYASSSSLYVATRPTREIETGMTATTAGVATVSGTSVNGVPEPDMAEPDVAAPDVEELQARQAIVDPKTSVTTYIHKFDITDPKIARYSASGQVDGKLLSQFAMSEHQGVLRVAATRYHQGRWQPTDSFVATLAQQGDKMNEMGRVGGLGKTEQIRSVRFMGDKAFVVTFRQTDPLYTVDLVNPAAPVVLGELKIEGYSAYLHPLAPGYLLGVGRDADSQGRIKGLQVSIFDVRDLRSPKRVHNYTVANAGTQVEWDHRAFLHWPKTQSLVLPVQGGFEKAEGMDSYFSGALLLGVDPVAGISLRARIEHKQGVEPNPEPGSKGWYPMPIERSVVVGDRLWTMSSLGMKASSMTDGAELDWLAY